MSKIQLRFNATGVENVWYYPSHLFDSMADAEKYIKKNINWMKLVESVEIKITKKFGTGDYKNE